MTADQFKARKLARLLEDALVDALGSPEQARRTQAAETLASLEGLLDGLKP